MYTVEKQAVVIQNPDVCQPGLVELYFQVPCTEVIQIGGSYFVEPREVAQLVEVDSSRPVGPQVAWISGYLAESLGGFYHGYEAKFTEVNENPDWF